MRTIAFADASPRKLKAHLATGAPRYKAVETQIRMAWLTAKLRRWIR